MRLPQHLIAREGYHGTISKAIEEVERNKTQCQLYKIPSKLEVAPHALKMWTGWMDGWMGNTP